ncbi:hypothetical protein F4821DRAFT_263963 [Hypoxylon rubiginosum]|uniref:Uncharacterized protein n=1 Tax=Hypoxylon rubiginosum TaxID=110542 RepID=A0ACC0CPW2_9PEZI|nr:hypothetical protein F4821DRAFT_263963 [Hypoxylon rubiginosum]
MKLVCTLSLAALAALASAGCFSGGQKWDGDKQAVLDKIDAVCADGTLNREYPAGSWDDDQPITYDWDVTTTRRVHLGVWLNNIWGNTVLSTSDCKSGLRKEVDGCEHGGQSEYTHWKYRADINAK